MENQKKRRCYNCKYGGDQFKIDKLTHLHCYGPEYEKADKNGEYLSPWETLRVFSNFCKDHEFKTNKTDEKI